MGHIATVTFDYNGFNNTTHRNADMRRHGIANVHRDSGNGLLYINGDLGCGKYSSTVRAALKHYLGGRELLTYRVLEQSCALSVDEC
jgi:hypothetical protein